MSRAQESTLIDWTANNTFNATNTNVRRRLTREELSAKINYPTYRKRQEKLEPLRTDIGRRALEIFHTQKRAFGFVNNTNNNNNNNNANRNVAAAAAPPRAPSSTAATGDRGSSTANGRLSAAAAAAAQQQQQNNNTNGYVPLVDLPNLPPNKLDAELTRYLEAIATGGASEGATTAAAAAAAANSNTAASRRAPSSSAAAAAPQLLSIYREAETYLGAAVILQLKGRFTDALEYFSKCVAADPLLTECYLHRAQCYTRLDRPAEALEEYKKYLQMEPATKALLADAGKSALDANRLDEAEQLFLACLSIGAPSSFELASTTLTTHEGTIVAAGAASVAALLLRNRQQQMQRTSPPINNTNGTEHNFNASASSAAAMSEGAADGSGGPATGDSSGGVAAAPSWNIADDIAMASEDATHDSYSFYNLGEVEERRGNAARALKYYAKVHPSFATPYFDQGRAEFGAENYPMALRLFEAVAKVLPDEVSVHLWLADTYTALGINEFSLCVVSCLTKAIALPEKISTAVSAAAAEELLAADPDCKHLEATLLRRGMLYLNILNDLENALRDFSVCLAYNHHNSDALLSRARTLLLRNNAGDEAAAVTDYELVVTLQSVPQNEKAHPYEILGLFYEKKKRFVEAGRFLALAVCAGAQPPARSLYRCATYAIASTAPTTANGAEELPHRVYDARGWIPKNDGADEKNTKKASSSPSASSPNGGLLSGAGNAILDGVPRSAAVIPLSYSLVDSYYDGLRAREPTIHRGDECSAIETWQPVRVAVDRRKEEAEAAKNNKKKKR